MVMIYDYYQGIEGFIAALLVRALLAYGVRQRTHWLTWYKGMPARTWLGMWMLTRGAKMVRNGSFVERFNGRIWISPKVHDFKLPHPHDAEEDTSFRYQ